MAIVHYMQDRNRVSPEINCNVCVKCGWRDSRKSDFCTFGGPFIGYDETRLPQPVETASVSA